MRVVLRLVRHGIPAVALMLAACSSLQDSGPIINSWGTAPLKDGIGGDERTAATGPLRPAAERPTSRTTYVEGTGRFVGEPPPRIASDPSEQGITLNLVNVPVPQAAKTVLGDILAVQYAVHPSIEGKVTIQTPKPVSKQAVLELFEVALAGNNAAVTKAGGAYQIVPRDQAIAGARLSVGAGQSSDGLGAGAKIIQLKYVSAQEMKLVLEPISPRGGVLQADSSRNILTLSGNSQEISGMLEAISIFDVDVMKGMSFAMVPVKASQPAAIAGELEKVFATEREGPMAGMVRFLPNKRLGSILIISPQRQYLARAEAWVKRLDAQALGTQKQFYTYKVQNRRAQELVDVLRSMFSRDGGSGNSGRNVTPRSRESDVRSGGFGASKQSRFGSAQSGGGGFPSSDRGGFGDADGAASETGSNGASAAHITFGDEADDPAPFKIASDDAKNTILIEAAPSEYERIVRVLETLDVMPNQVLIEATIAEVGLTDELKFGLRWHFKDNASSFAFTDSAAGAINSVFPGFSYALKATNIAMTLNALNQITDVNVVASPSLTVMDNKTATLQIGDQVPIATQSAVSVIDPSAPIVNSVSYRDTGVILSITPRINETGRVLLDIEQEVSSVAATSTSGIDSPTIRQRRVKTTVMVNDGESIALGGLIQQTRNKSRSQIPIVGDIPIIGNVFKDKEDTNGKSELIILITPRVMRDVEEARQITAEYRTEFEAQVRKSRDKSRAVENAARRTFD